MQEGFGSQGDRVSELVRKSGLTIYDPLDASSPLYFDIKTLEKHLNTKLEGLNLDYPLRTRAKFSKSYVAAALGYPIPTSFVRTKPRFPGQNLDVYVQKANNLQIWNEDVDPLRRYVLIRVDENSTIRSVRVVTGETIALLDRTGTLTQKYQARRRDGQDGSMLVSAADTDHLQRALSPSIEGQLDRFSPLDRPTPGFVLPISEAYTRLRGVVGASFQYGNLDQERNRGAVIHRLACQLLGYRDYADNGQFPDILNQVIEVKLQTSPTIDLGMISPDDTSLAEDIGFGLRHRDVRYAIFYGRRAGDMFFIADLVMTTGELFFTEFRRFEGMVTNRKLQIPLPHGFFR